MQNDDSNRQRSKFQKQKHVKDELLKIKQLKFKLNVAIFSLICAICLVLLFMRFVNL